MFVSLLCCICLLTACTKAQESTDTVISQSSQTSVSQNSLSTSTTSDNTVQTVETSEENTYINSSDNKEAETQINEITPQYTATRNSSIAVDAISNGDHWKILFLVFNLLNVGGFHAIILQPYPIVFFYLLWPDSGIKKRNKCMTDWEITTQSFHYLKKYPR